MEARASGVVAGPRQTLTRQDLDNHYNRVMFQGRILIAAVVVAVILIIVYCLAVSGILRIPAHAAVEE
jgi:hypothetical protein